MKYFDQHHCPDILLSVLDKLCWSCSSVSMIQLLCCCWVNHHNIHNYCSSSWYIFWNIVIPPLHHQTFDKVRHPIIFFPVSPLWPKPFMLPSIWYRVSIKQRNIVMFIQYRCHENQDLHYVHHYDSSWFRRGWQLTQLQTRELRFPNDKFNGGNLLNMMVKI